MIHRLRIVNFQSLADVTIDLGKLTVVTGSSNVGKSSLVRAVRTLLTNPRGDWYRREGSAGEVRVGLAVDLLPADGTEAHINFWRGKQVRYSIEWRNVPDAIDPPDQEYSAVGTSVPEDVTKTLAIDPAVQVSDQFDPLFLLSDTAAGRARILGALTRADLLMRGVSHATTSAREAEARAKALDAIVARDQDRLDSEFAWYEPVAREAIALQAVDAEMRGVAQRHSAALQVLGVLQDAAPRLERLEAALGAAAEPLAEAVHLAGELGVQQAKIAGVKKLAADLILRSGDLSALEMAFADSLDRVDEAAADLETAVAAMDVCPTCGLKLTKKAKEHLAHA